MQAIEFFLANLEELKPFMRKMQRDFGQDSMCFALKMFILNQNKVFDMPAYMKKQSDLAEEYIKDYVKEHERELSPEERRDILNLWVRDNAEACRKQAIFEQIDGVEKECATIIPAIKHALTLNKPL